MIPWCAFTYLDNMSPWVVTWQTMHKWTREKMFWEMLRVLLFLLSNSLKPWHETHTAEVTFLHSVWCTLFAIKCWCFNASCSLLAVLFH